jgi:hypothetical protein
MQPARAFDVFISYSTDDLEYARLVRRAVENLGFRAFLAETSLAAGERLQVIRNHLQRSKLLVLLWSESASKSEWVRDEVGAAWGANVPVIPVLLTSGLELPPSLRTSGVKYQNAVSKDSASLLDVQSAVIAWWQDVLARHAAHRAALEEQRRQQQAESTKAVLGIAAAGAVLYALSKS